MTSPYFGPIARQQEDAFLALQHRYYQHFLDDLGITMSAGMPFAGVQGGSSTGPLETPVPATPRLPQDRVNEILALPQGAGSWFKNVLREIDEPENVGHDELIDMAHALGIEEAEEIPEEGLREMVKARRQAGMKEPELPEAERALLGGLGGAALGLIKGAVSEPLNILRGWTERAEVAELTRNAAMPFSQRVALKAIEHSGQLNRYIRSLQENVRKNLSADEAESFDVVVGASKMVGMFLPGELAFRGVGAAAGLAMPRHWSALSPLAKMGIQGAATYNLMMPAGTPVLPDSGDLQTALDPNTDAGERLGAVARAMLGNRTGGTFFGAATAMGLHAIHAKLQRSRATAKFYRYEGDAEVWEPDFEYVNTRTAGALPGQPQRRIGAGGQPVEVGTLDPNGNIPPRGPVTPPAAPPAPPVRGGVTAPNVPPPVESFLFPEAAPPAAVRPSGQPMPAWAAGGARPQITPTENPPAMDQYTELVDWFRANKRLARSNPSLAGIQAEIMGRAANLRTALANNALYGTPVDQRLLDVPWVLTPNGPARRDLTASPTVQPQASSVPNAAGQHTRPTITAEPPAMQTPPWAVPTGMIPAAPADLPAIGPRYARPVLSAEVTAKYPEIRGMVERSLQLSGKYQSWIQEYSNLEMEIDRAEEGADTSVHTRRDLDIFLASMPAEAQEAIRLEQIIGNITQEIQQEAGFNVLPEDLAASRGQRSVTPAGELALAAGTAVRNTDGTPMTLYHGTGTVFDEFDISKTSAAGLYGPGIYLSNRPEIVGGDPLTMGVLGNAQNVLPPITFGSANTPYAFDRYYKQQTMVKNLESDLYQVRKSIEDIDSGAYANSMPPERIRKLRQDRVNKAEEIEAQLAEMPQAGVNVKPVYVASKNILELDEPLPIAEADRILDAIVPTYGEQWSTGVQEARENYDRSGPPISSAGAFYDFLADLGTNAVYDHSLPLTDVNSFGKARVNELLRNLGYEAMHHEGGRRAGEQPHDTFIVLDVRKIIPKYSDREMIESAAKTLGVQLDKQNEVMTSPALAEVAAGSEVTDTDVGRAMLAKYPNSVIVIKGVVDPAGTLRDLVVGKMSISGINPKSWRVAEREGRIDLLVTPMAEISNEMVRDYQKYGLMTGMRIKSVASGAAKEGIVSSIYEKNGKTYVKWFRPGLAGMGTRKDGTWGNRTSAPTLIKNILPQNDAPFVWESEKLWQEWVEYAEQQLMTLHNEVGVQGYGDPGSQLGAYTAALRSEGVIGNLNPKTGRYPILSNGNQVAEVHLDFGSLGVVVDDFKATVKGGGVSAMRLLTKFADHTGTVLEGEPKVFGVGGLTQERLEQFYRKFGFDYEGKSIPENWMIRYPIRKNEAGEAQPTNMLEARKHLPQLFDEFVDSKGIEGLPEQVALRAYFDARMVDEYRQLAGELNQADFNLARGIEELGDVAPSIHDLAAARDFTAIPAQAGPGVMLRDNVSVNTFSFEDETAATEFLRNFTREPQDGDLGGDVPVEITRSMRPSTPHMPEAGERQLADQEIRNAASIDRAVAAEEAEELRATGTIGAASTPPNAPPPPPPATPPISRYTGAGAGGSGGTNVPPPPPPTAPPMPPAGAGGVPANLQTTAAQVNRQMGRFRYQVALPARRKFADMQMLLEDAGYSTMRPYDDWAEITAGLNRANNLVYDPILKLDGFFKQIRSERLTHGRVWQLLNVTNPAYRAQLSVHRDFRFSDRELAAVNQMEAAVADYFGADWPLVWTDLKRFVRDVQVKQIQNDPEPYGEASNYPTIGWFVDAARERHMDFVHPNAAKIFRQFLQSHAFNKEVGPAWDRAQFTWRTLSNLRGPSGRTDVAMLADHFLDWMHGVRYGRGIDDQHDVLLTGVRGALDKVGIHLTMGEASNLINGGISTMYRAIMGWKPAMIIRDAFQPLYATPRIGLSALGRAYKLMNSHSPARDQMLDELAASGAIHKGIPPLEQHTQIADTYVDPQHQQFTPEQLARRERITRMRWFMRDMLPPSLRTIQGTKIDPMWLYNQQSAWSRTIVGAGARLRWNDAFTEWGAARQKAIRSGNLTGIPTTRQLLDALEVSTMHPSRRRAIQEMIDAGDFAGAKDRYTNEVVNEAMHVYGAHQNPTAWRGHGMRMGTMFGTFASNTVSWFDEMVRYGGVSFRAKALMMLGITSGSIYYIAKKSKWNVWSYLLFNPLYLGGPLLETAIATFETAKAAIAPLTPYGPTYQDEAAINALSPERVIPRVARMVNPAAGAFQAYEGVTNAMTAPDPGEAFARWLLTNDRRGGAVDWRQQFADPGVEDYVPPRPEDFLFGPGSGAAP